MKIFIMLGALAGFSGVAFGAFGAHALKAKLSAEMLTIFNTGVQYHLVHALALLGAAFAIDKFPQGHAHIAGWAFTFGIVVFSGSLYALAISGVRILGAITPIGGVAFLIGWLALFWTGFKG